LILLLLLASSTPAPASVPPAAAAPGVATDPIADLLAGPRIIDRACPPAANGDILVCGRRQASPFLLPEAYAPRGMTMPHRLMAQTDLGHGVVGSATVTQVEFPGGFVSQRATINILIPF
jgi:hypothetical protein